MGRRDDSMEAQTQLLSCPGLSTVGRLLSTEYQAPVPGTMPAYSWQEACSWTTWLHTSLPVLLMPPAQAVWLLWLLPYVLRWGVLRWGEEVLARGQRKFLIQADRNPFPPQRAPARPAVGTQRWRQRGSDWPSPHSVA